MSQGAAPGLPARTSAGAGVGVPKPRVGPFPPPRLAPDDMTRGPTLAFDPAGVFFTAVGKQAVRLSPARPGPRVALVFDDGPGPQTLDVLRELRRAGARATFFVVGREAARQPALVRAVRDAGMELGSHGWSHVPMAGLDYGAQRREILLTADELARAAGAEPRLFRPPDVAWDPLTAYVASAAGELGVLHTIETGDWRLPGPAAIAAAAEQAGPGDIVALHDAGGDRSQTVAAIRPIVRTLRDRGLACVTVSELLGAPPPGAAGGGFSELERRLAAPPS